MPDIVTTVTTPTIITTVTPINTITSTVNFGPPGPGLPIGGNTGQVPVKNSDNDYDIKFINFPISLPDQGAHEGQLLTTDGINASWATFIEDLIAAGVSTRAPSQKAVKEALDTLNSNLTDALAAKVQDSITDGVTDKAPSQNAVYDALATRDTAIAAKADTTTVNTALATKADSSAMATALAAKADVSAVNTALATKADSATMATALAAKADTATVNTALAAKADTTTVNTALAGKLDTDFIENSITAGVTDKAPSEDAVNTALGNKLDNTKAAIEGKLTGVISSHTHAASLPTQTGHAGQVLTTDGTNPTWEDRAKITDAIAIAIALG